MSVQYYVPICRGVTIRNPNIVPLLLHMRWYNQRPASEIHVEISHPDTAEPNSFIHSTGFHGLLWDDVRRCDASGTRRARLRLEGRRDDEDIFALFEFDMGNNYGTITLSPVPFGLDGKPHLPHVGENLTEFLRDTATVLSEREWSSKSLVCRVYELTGRKNYCHTSAWCQLCWMAKLGLVSWPNGVKRRENSDDMVKNGIFTTVMSAKQFGKIFGLRLPTVPPAGD